MADETSICNLALGILGQNAIMSLDDASQAARFCKQFYAHTRDAVLQSAQWNFAIKRASLSRLSDAPISGWLHQYQLPADHLRVIELNGADISSRFGEFAIEGNRLLTDDDGATIRYISRVEDANLFDALFVETLATKLASKLAKPLTGNAQEAQALTTEMVRLSGPAARRADAVEGKPRPILPFLNSSLVGSRGYIQASSRSAGGGGGTSAQGAPGPEGPRGPAGFSDIFLATDYGVTGDGETDDTLAISEVVAAAVAAGGGKVYFPSNKTYRIATPHVSGITLTGVSNLVFEMGPNSKLYMDNFVAGEPTGHGVAVNGPCANISFLNFHIEFAGMPTGVRLWSGWYCLGANIGDGDRSANEPAWYRGNPDGTQGVGAIYSGTIRDISLIGCSARNVANAFASFNNCDGIVLHDFYGFNGYGSGIYCQCFRRLNARNVRLERIDDDGFALLSNEGGIVDNDIEDDFHGEHSTLSDIVIDTNMPDYPNSVPSGGIAIGGIRDLAVSNVTITGKVRGIKIEYGTQTTPGDPFEGLGIHFLASRRITLGNFAINACTNPIYFLNKESTLATDPRWWQSEIRMENITCGNSQYLFVTDFLTGAPVEMPLVYGVTISGVRSTNEATTFSTLRNLQNCTLNDVEVGGQLSILGFVPFGIDPDTLVGGQPYADNNLTLHGLKGKTITFSGVRGAYISDLTSFEADGHGLEFLGCADFVIETMKVIYPNRLNTVFKDGCNVDALCRRMVCELYEFRQDETQFGAALSIQGTADRFNRFRLVRVQTDQDLPDAKIFDECFVTTGTNLIKRIEWIHYGSPFAAWLRRETPDNNLITGAFADTDQTVYVDTNQDIYRIGSVLTRNVTYTFATGAASKGSKKTVVRLPSATGPYWIDVGGVKTIPPGSTGSVTVMYNGTSWELLDYSLTQGVSSDRGDANITLTAGKDFAVQRFLVAFTANRTLTLSTTGARAGDKFRILRQNANAFTLNIGGIKTFPASVNSWVDVEFEGFAWIVTASGTL